jgi:3-hydroxyacyl-CoA dehydrogenase/enoyl-CoA hydratase/3-hydroxybutyryl-CoA epimerase
VVTHPEDGDIGSIFGWGFPPYTGGTLSYIDEMGVAEFVKLCRRLQREHGPRFRPNRLLNDMARSGETFYTRFAPPRAA